MYIYNYKYIEQGRVSSTGMDRRHLGRKMFYFRCFCYHGDYIFTGHIPGKASPSICQQFAATSTHRNCKYFTIIYHLDCDLGNHDWLAHLVKGARYVWTYWESLGSVK